MRDLIDYLAECHALQLELEGEYAELPEGRAAWPSLRQERERLELLIRDLDGNPQRPPIGDPRFARIRCLERIAFLEGSLRTRWIALGQAAARSPEPHSRELVAEFLEDLGSSALQRLENLESEGDALGRDLQHLRLDGCDRAL
jgi:hypothetical protein